MFSIPGQPVIDETALIGGCSRLPVSCDAARMQADVAALPARFWNGTGGRTGPHHAAQAVFLRGYAPAQGDLPIEDRDALAFTPYLRELITTVIPAPPLRCLLASLPAGGVIAPHSDQAEYFRQSVRVHFPIITNADVWMLDDGLVYQMREGEIWALNNSMEHGVWNANAEQARIHMICDFLPSAGLLALLAGADRTLGTRNANVEAKLFRSPAPFAPA